MPVDFSSHSHFIIIWSRLDYLFRLLLFSQRLFFFFVHCRDNRKGSWLYSSRRLVRSSSLNEPRKAIVEQKYLSHLPPADRSSIRSSERPELAIVRTCQPLRERKSVLLPLHRLIVLCPFQVNTCFQHSITCPLLSLSPQGYAEIPADVSLER